MLIAFLGNPDSRYERTRHNAAWIVAAHLPLTQGAAWQKKFKGQYAKTAAGQIGVPVLHLLKPQTYMNRSGLSVAPALDFFKIPPSDLLVVHDELEIEQGLISLKWAGGLGGHNGLRSIKAELGTADFWRLRIGIGRPAGKDVADYVLSPFTLDEMHIITSAADAVKQVLDVFLAEGADRTAVLKEYAKYRYKEKETL